MRGAQEQRCDQEERKGSLHRFVALLAIAILTRARAWSCSIAEATEAMMAALFRMANPIMNRVAKPRATLHRPSSLERVISTQQQQQQGAP